MIEIKFLFNQLVQINTKSPLSTADIKFKKFNIYKTQKYNVPKGRRKQVFKKTTSKLEIK